MEHVLTALVGFLVFIFSVVVHETAHGVVAEHFGDPTARLSGRITLNPIPHIDPIGSVLIPIMAFVSSVPFIGWAKPVPVNSANLRNPLVHNAYVAAAGPASNLLLICAGSVLWILVRVLFKHIPALDAGGENTLLFFDLLCQNLIMINSVLLVFNLLPIPPLDGHWILMRFLPPGPREMLAAIAPFGFFILLILLWVGVLGAILSVPLKLLYLHALAFVNWMVNLL